MHSDRRFVNTHTFYEIYRVKFVNTPELLQCGAYNSNTQEHILQCDKLGNTNINNKLSHIFGSLLEQEDAEKVLTQVREYSSITTLFFGVV